MTSEYGESKQNIKRARQHLNRVVGLLDSIATNYADIPCISKFFETFKPALVMIDDSLITLLHMITDPEPFNKEIENGNHQVNDNETIA